MSQPNPTDDLEAAKAWAERTLRNGLLDRPEDDTHLRTLISALRPAGVGEADEAVEYSAADLQRLLNQRDDFIVERGMWNDFVDWLPRDSATPAQPDAALMERVRTVLENARDDMEAWGAYADEYFREKHDLAGDLAAIDALLSDLKAEAGR